MSPLRRAAHYTSRRLARHQTASRNMTWTRTPSCSWPHQEEHEGGRDGSGVDVRGRSAPAAGPAALIRQPGGQTLQLTRGRWGPRLECQSEAAQIRAVYAKTIATCRRSPELRTTHRLTTSPAARHAAARWRTLHHDMIRGSNGSGKGSRFTVTSHVPAEKPGRRGSSVVVTGVQVTSHQSLRDLGIGAHWGDEDMTGRGLSSSLGIPDVRLRFLELFPGRTPVAMAQGRVCVLAWAWLFEDMVGLGIRHQNTYSTTMQNVANGKLTTIKVGLWFTPYLDMAGACACFAAPHRTAPRRTMVGRDSPSGHLAHPWSSGEHAASAREGKM
ncbi:hypothetical protein CSOJ01_11825 [Colletotrichum sojae]|uniref:Uncharacterized protein n=1 Tax=Colletotrichum sojae TaxID=2175907 RepID=A0A8H6MNA9_9PEZI|nr:hypothetical protein CSOJ01_11825 [Colletotrichum sojae]